jgi:hypothetical protein
MAKLIGNYQIPGQTKTTTSETAAKPDTNSVAEFERRAMEHLGGSIAFVMKGKNVVWSGTKDSQDGGKKA